jgi:hypothetical protein
MFIPVAFKDNLSITDAFTINITLLGARKVVLRGERGVT